jgi:hypothetical protein
MKKLARILKKFKVLDLFGEPISLTYKKKRTYKTTYGGLITVLIIILITL